MKRIFALPYAIGSSTIYYELKQTIPQIHPLEYPGHGCRIDEDCLTDIKAIAQDMYEQIRDYTDEQYGLMGYSMGTLVAYELYKLLCKNQVRKPDQILLFACDTPGVKRAPKGFNQMGKQELKEEIFLLNGTSRDVLEERELMELVYPVARADLAAIENYQDNDPVKISVPTVVVRGTKEDMLDESINCWNNYCECSRKILVEGGHFFLFTDPDSCKPLLSNVLGA